MTRKRRAAPAPQKRDVPITASRAFRLFKSERVRMAKDLTIGTKEKRMARTAGRSLRGMRIALNADAAYHAVIAVSAPSILQSVRAPPATAPNNIAAIVEASSKLLALTSCVGVTSSPKIPYLAGELAAAPAPTSA